MVAPQPSWGGQTMPPRAAAPTGVSLDGLEWRQLGPFRGGRGEAVARDPPGRDTLYFGSVRGGAWEKPRRGPYPRTRRGRVFSTAPVWAGAGSAHPTHVTY